jgi:hypothetical protein
VGISDHLDNQYEPEIHNVTHIATVVLMLAQTGHARTLYRIFHWHLIKGAGCMDEPEIQSQDVHPQRAPAFASLLNIR